MAANGTIWEIRTTGSDTNGGGFIAGSGRTDYSQQNGPIATGTVTSASTTVTATTAIFTSAMVGNYMTNGTTWVEITAFTSSTIVTVNTAPSWTTQTVKIGGALATPNGWATAAGTATSQTAYVAAGTYSIAANIAPTCATVVPGTAASPNQIIGYQTVRGDSPLGVNAPLLQANGTPTEVIQLTTAGWLISNLQIDCASSASNGINSGTNVNITIRGVTVENHDARAITSTGATGVVITGCTIKPDDGDGSGIQVATATVVGNYIYNQSTTSIVATGGIVKYNLIVNSGSTAVSSSGPGDFSFNTIDQCGTNGISYTGAGTGGLLIQGNIISNVSNIGLDFSSALIAGNFPEIDGNFYYNNGTNRANCGTGIADVLLTASPYVATGNYALNATAGGGASVRTAGPYNSWSGNSATIGYRDGGSVQTGRISTDPGIANVRSGTAYQVNGQSLTGTFNATNVIAGLLPGLPILM